MTVSRLCDNGNLRSTLVKQVSVYHHLMHEMVSNGAGAPTFRLSSIILATFLILISFASCYAQGSCPDTTPSTVTCSGGRTCPSEHLCISGLCCPSCNRRLKDLAAVPPLGTLVPRCDPSGNYSSEQCQGSNGQCFCVSESGEEIPNTRVLPGDFRSRNCDQERQRFTGGGFGSGSGFGSSSGSGSGSGFGSGPGSAFAEGECPPAVGFGVCLNRCSSDSDCAREGRKCCSNGCGKQCMLPVANRPGSSATGPGGGGLFETKAGSCPINTSPDLSRPSNIRDECSSDSTCIGVQKCCFTSGGYRCTYPVGDVGSDNKPGYCPPLPAGFSTSSFLINRCQRDSECSGSTKCCETTSGRVCQLPTTQPQISPIEIQGQCDNFPNEVFETCASPCPIACDNQDNPPQCPGQGCIQGCVCRLGYIRSSSRDPRSPCVPRTQCPPSSGGGGSFGGFGQTIPTPGVFSNFTKVGVCPSGDLNPQIIQSINNGQATVCNQDSQCPGEQKCCTPQSGFSSAGNGSQRCLCPDPNAVWRQCGTLCPEMCPERIGTTTTPQCGSQCLPGCFCVEGYVRLNNSPSAPCVLRSVCPSSTGGPGSGLAFGPSVNAGFNTGANSKAVARIAGNGSVDGVITFTQIGNQVQISGTIRGLTPGQHGLHIHQYGDVSSNCANIGDHYNPDNRQHGGPQERERHLGDLGNINADRSGAALVSFSDNQIALFGSNSVIGRTLAVHEREDDLGHGSGLESHRSGNSGNVIGCGVIGVSP